MNRRQFLVYSSACAASLILRRTNDSGQTTDKEPLSGVTVIDAHAHPDQFFSTRPQRDWTSTFGAMSAAGMSGSSFAALGDLQAERGGPWEPRSMDDVRQQFGRLNQYVDAKQIRVVRKASDMPIQPRPGEPRGAILSLEGADPLVGDAGRVKEIAEMGVRIVTLVHYTVNEIGDIMSAGPKHNGLTPAGRKIVERMQETGIVVDVAHAHPVMLRQLVEVCAKPVIDSHTCPSFREAPSQETVLVSRLRTWKEMETIAGTGGLVCTWPLAYMVEGFKRDTFTDWAWEIFEMKKRLGIEHVALGTDGGGQLPRLISGYRDVRDLSKLAQAMREVGLSPDDIQAYMGGNLLRVLKAHTG